MTWLGIDIGTSGVKSILLDENQQVLHSSSAPLDVSRPHPVWSEQNPHDWWDAVLSTVDAIAAACPAALSRTRGIGLSGQMHGATLLDADDDVLRPAILWNDGRSASQCATLDASADFRGIGGNLVMPGFTAPKLEWVLQNEPDTFDKINKILLPKDYIRFELSGEYISEMSDSAGTLWLDVAARDWSDTLLAATGLDRGKMPALVEGSAIGGTLKPALAQRWNMAAAPVLAGGGGDNAASACGVGAITPGGGFLSLGTSGVLFVCNDAFSPNTDDAVHAFCHAVPDTWHQMGVILSATDALNWLSGIAGATPAELSAAAAKTEPQDAPLFLPYLSGERTPHNNADARGGFLGLSHSSDVGALARSVMEGVAFAFADCAGALGRAGAQMDRVLAIGGGANSAVWLQIIADATGLVLQTPTKGDFGAAFGAARLAMCASENAAPAELMHTPEIEAETVPDPTRRGLYADRYERFRAAYPAVS